MFDDFEDFPGIEFTESERADWEAHKEDYIWQADDGEYVNL